MGNAKKRKSNHSCLDVKFLKDNLLSGKYTSQISRFLRQCGFSDPDQAFRDLASLIKETRSQEEGLDLIHFLLPLFGKIPSPNQALNYFERFACVHTHPEMLYSFLKKVPRTREILVHLFSMSPALSESLIKNPEYFSWVFDPQILEVSWDKEAFRQDIDNTLKNLMSWPARLNALKRFKRRHMLRIGLKDLLQKESIEETICELSLLADICLEWAYQFSKEDMEKKFGSPKNENEPHQISNLAVIAMGKWGGLELNFSSDIDMMFVYSFEGKTSGGNLGVLDNHIFFTQLAQGILKILSERTQEGYLYRVDTRLRPEGPTGPLVRSLESYEHYYASWGASWERQALMKGRCAAGDEQMGEEFLKRVEPFIYRKYMDHMALEDMRLIKTKIDEEVAGRNKKGRDVKLGEGGIREIEFGVQILQLLYGGKRESLRQRGSLDALFYLAKSGLLQEKTSQNLKRAYLFLRRVEHALQLEFERQTHVLPEDSKKLFLFSQCLGYSTPEAFLRDYDRETQWVHQFYQDLFKSLSFLKSGDHSSILFGHLFERKRLSEEEEVLLTNCGFKNIESAKRNLLLLRNGTEEVLVSADSKIFQEILPQFIESLKKALDPDQALIGFERFVSSYKARHVFYEMLRASPRILDLLIMLFGTSLLLTEILIRNPNYFDCLTSGILDEKGLDEARHSGLLEVIDSSISLEKKIMALSDYKNLEMLKTGLRDILGFNLCMEILEQLSLLAERMVGDAFKMAVQIFRKRYRKKPPSFGVVGLGKLGGRELGYGSDLDIVFVCETDAAHLEDANRLGSIILEILERSSLEGPIYKMDPRLRPDGSKGPLVQDIETFKSYYQNSNSIWERMALTRARWIVGIDSLGKNIMKILGDFIFKSPVSQSQAQEIRSIRDQIVQERCRGVREGFELKSGLGGLLDIEFLAQFLQLKWGRKYSELKETHTLKLLEKLSSRNLISGEEVDFLMKAYLFYREVECTLRLIKNRPTDFLPKDEELVIKIQRKMNRALDPEQFYKLLDHFATRVRHIYDQNLIVKRSENEN
ncbi:MAG: bifunctional [glutamate--ammonia ligase]-adenylyl-L-tyrosine phosphorylase/[glutamate--ammonia-ligase] adenylyltransferase [Chlamydiae bacterium]|nr:bifunctional [glutamate--ammonia ligase]-adenylyl-L-tyrosine phosphorylase/[glutamate--ammonia-ligase] adenylyltransferase [Chlamydiota bacterium]MBI3277575.1 bifunctional [glutamate--ammonia ligase]-adenylyl-L-tyrosine phosphorylase/[glutamate--ammonia-ligase] adenylyltransferase [Chlamydiota bacterium]